ncbi:hypothetical protein [Gelidibacter sp.]|uniref:hypothetical protein n=1 Tax=Gelidibacter sp. TaxID=2018083 RepID=UPI002D806460|nr:hypothetical protein [Gelidibacter sp.]
MIDFIKLNLINTDFDYIETHPLLDFMMEVNTKTGELKNVKKAYYKGLEFRLYEPTEKTNSRRLTLEGSLHKYWNNGAHNFNDFGINELDEVLNDLKECFNILQSNCVLRTLEIGVNIEPPYKTKTILNQCLLHKTDRLKWIYTKDEGNYIQSKHQRHIIKIYDKRTHYKNKGFTIDKEILRFEIKYTKMRYLHSKGIYSLNNLLNYGLHHFKTDLLKEWDNVLICDKSIISKTKYKDQYDNINFWLDLNYNNFKYHRNNLKRLTAKQPDNIKKKIADLIKKKCEILNTNTTQINPLYIRLKTVVSTSTNTDQNRRFCKVTNLNISMQKVDSILLSHTGLRYYHKTDKKIYKEVKNKYLSKLWINADHATQIKQIAHNIRCKSSNTMTSRKRKHNPLQMELF